MDQPSSLTGDLKLYNDGVPENVMIFLPNQVEGGESGSLWRGRQHRHDVGNQFGCHHGRYGCNGAHACLNMWACSVRLSIARPAGSRHRTRRSYQHQVHLLY